MLMITVIVCPLPHITECYIVTSAAEINLKERILNPVYTEQTNPVRPGLVFVV